MSAIVAQTAAATPTPLVADPRALVSEHVDINIGYAGGAWSIGPRDSDNGIQYAGHQGIHHVDQRAMVSVPSGYDFTGAAAGSPLYVLPQSQDPSLLYLGFAAYGVPTNTFDTYDASAESNGRVSGIAQWLQLRLDSVKGPGQFSVWNDGSLGSATAFMSTASGGVNSDDALWIAQGGHLHFNFGFTQRGLYQVNLRPSGKVGGNMTAASVAAAVYFNVDPGYTTSGLVASSSQTPLGQTAMTVSGFSEVTPVGPASVGKLTISNVEPGTPVYLLLDLADADELGALIVALSGSANYELPGESFKPNLLSLYGLQDIPATATIDNSVLAGHAGYDLALRFNSLPGGSFDFEYDYSMVLDGVGIQRFGVMATAAVPEPAAIGLLGVAGVMLLRRCRQNRQGNESRGGCSAS